MATATTSGHISVLVTGGWPQSNQNGWPDAGKGGLGPAPGPGPGAWPDSGGGAWPGGSQTEGIWVQIVKHLQILQQSKLSLYLGCLFCGNN